MTETSSDTSAPDIARQLLAQSPSPLGAGQAGEPGRSAGGPFANHPEIGAGRARAMPMNALIAMTGMPNPAFLLRKGPNDVVIDGPTGPLLNFSSYNYLGLASHPKVIHAAQDALAQYGASASASRIFSGGTELYVALESRLAALYDVDAAVISASGYVTNAGVIGFLVTERDAIVCDALAHASIFSGSRWSGARQMTFRHNDPESLRGLLRMARARFERVLVVIEGHYSMDGDIGKLPEIASVAREFDCAVMIDEAHSLGVLGARGHGVREHFGLASDAVDIWMGTLSKALGSCGGFIAGDGELLLSIRALAPGVEQFTGGPSPASAAAALAALDVMEAEPERLQKLWCNAETFSSALRERGLDLGLSQNTPICPVMVTGELQVGFSSSVLMQRGIYVGPVVSPGVQPGQERLRFFLTSEHTEDQLQHAADQVAEVVELAGQLGGYLAMTGEASNQTPDR